MRKDKKTQRLSRKLSILIVIAMFLVNFAPIIKNTARADTYSSYTVLFNTRSNTSYRAGASIPDGGSALQLTDQYGGFSAPHI